MGKEEVAYLDTGTKTWQYTNCKSSYVAEQGTITYDLKNDCGINDGTTIMLGVKKEGAVGACSDGANAKDWSEPMIADSSGDKMYSYAGFRSG
ncbi:MAG: hypothetical protein LBP35_06885 [Candidatus Ancillula trichonymphae]|jgi:hypothetical protein|nr:hypothetical protein [Candidatus Ancillula trichonymphae]